MLSAPFPVRLHTAMSDTRFPPSSRAALLCAALLASLAACDSGANATASGGVRPTLITDYALRRDVGQTSDVVSDVEAVDLDADGLADLVQANSIARTLLVQFGAADGSFGAAQTLACAGVPWRSETGDFDGDGRLDLATVCLAGDGGAQASLQVRLQGPQARAFQAPRTLLFQGDPDDLAVGRASGLAGVAGPDELFVPISDQARVARCALVGSLLAEVGSLDSSALGRAGSAFAAAVFDDGADGTLDLAVAEAQVAGSTFGRVVVYPRAGADFGAPEIVLEPVYWPTVDAVGDVDGDGLDDLAVAQVDDDDALLVLGGSHALHPVPFGPGATGAVFEDLDGDGRVDAAAAAFREAAIYVRMGDGPLSWGPPVRYDAGFLPRALATVRLPGDALPDLVVANVSSVGLLANAGGGRFRAARGTPLSVGEPSRLRLSDLDHDGDLDAAVLALDGPAVLLLQNQGGGRFEEAFALAIPEGDAAPTDFVLVDGDGDGFADPIVTLAGLDRLLVLHNPFGATSLSGAGGIEVGAQPRGIAAGDLDGDQRPELVVALGEGRALEVLRADASGKYAFLRRDALDGPAEGVWLADLDLDGDLDAIVTTSLAGVPSVPPDPEARLLSVEWDGQRFVQRNGYPLDVATTSLGIANIDLDQDPDVVVAQRSSLVTQLFVFTNASDFAFLSKRVETGTAPTNVLLRDVDGDGRRDALLPSARGELLYALGDGRGGFPRVFPQELGRLAMLQGLADAASAQVDGDAAGLEDLLYVCPLAPVLWIAPNESQPIGP